ncbi:uncharacterized protein [Venturia canescens]|uniref:uncharacterized protein n=1 Tax=Venturia canescens TaxID=32260 RepID=UPI001C9C6A28|nr:uncharacterized protein LOC122417561 [Venturia canescens]
MRFIYVISCVLLCGVVDKVTCKFAKIMGTQVKTEVNPNQHFMATKTPITDGQNITWYKDMPVQGFLQFAGEVQYQKGKALKTTKLDWSAKLDLCEELGDESFADLAGQVLRTSWLPNGSCPVHRGTTYQLRNPFPATVDLPFHVKSKQYVLNLHVGFSQSNILFSTTYEIQVLKEEESLF